MKQLKHRGWVFTSNTGAMLSSKEADEATAFLKITLPEMVFGKNTISLEHEASKFVLYFNAIDALDRVNKTTDFVKVSYSQEWSAKRAHSMSEIKEVIKPFDWTYCSDYKGSFVRPETVVVAATEDAIDLDKLRQPDPILFFDDVLLYEDELADNGSSTMSVKMRVMPNSVFVLLRFFLRVDGVLVRINDTRLFHEFGTDFVLREYSRREQSFTVLNEVCPKNVTHNAGFYSDPENMSRYLELKELEKSKLAFVPQ